MSFDKRVLRNGLSRLHTLVGLLASFGLLSSLFHVPSQAQNKEVSRERLYVIDTTGGRLDSKVLVIDPQTGRLLKSLDAGYGPQIAVSPGGRLLYLTFVDYPEGPDSRWFPKLSVIDTRTWKVVLSVDNPDNPRWGHYPPYSALYPSPSGERVYIPKRRTIGSLDVGGAPVSQDIHWIETFDFKQGRFLSTNVGLPHCTGAQVFPLGKPWDIGIMCSGENLLMQVKLTQDGGIRKTAHRYIPVSPQWVGNAPNGIVQTVLSPDREVFTVCTRDGQLMRVNASDGRIESVGSKQDLAGRYVASTKCAVSPDGRLLYTACDLIGDYEGGYDEILVFDTESLRLVSSFNPDDEIWSLAMSGDGRRLYASAPKAKKVVVFDATTFEVIKSFAVGSSPSEIVFSSSGL